MWSSPARSAVRQVTTPGILGGMGPLAHVEFERRLIQRNLERGVTCDQDHPVWLLVGASDIPDRSQSLAGRAEDCTPWLVRYGRLLERAGADFLIVTCNTAHAFYPHVQPQLAVPWLHLMNCTAQHVAAAYPAAKRIGLLATNGTLQTGLYGQPLLQLGLSPMLPNRGLQEEVMQAIYHPDWGIKATGVWLSDQALVLLSRAVVSLAQQGADLVIAGCTELSVGLARLGDLPLPWVDPLDVVATLTLDLSYGQRSLNSLMAA